MKFEFQPTRIHDVQPPRAEAEVLRELRRLGRAEAVVCGRDHGHLVAQQARGDNAEPRERRGGHGDRGLRDRTRQRAFERRGVAADGSDDSLPSPLCPDVREPRPSVDRLQGSVRHGREDLPIAANIARDAERARLEKQIAALEKRARAEKQPKKKFGLVQQIKKFNLNSAVG